MTSNKSHGFLLAVKFGTCLFLYAGLKLIKATKTMASDAPLIGLNAPLKNHYFVVWPAEGP